MIKSFNRRIMYPGLPNHIIEERQDIIFRKVRGILNKITPETFDKLSKELVNVGLDSPRTLRGVIYLLFDKALKDLKYSSLYAKLCQILSEKVSNFEQEPGPNTFCKFLISKCEDEFERRRKATEDFDGKNELTDEEYELKAIAKLKMLGNIKFICELGKKRLLQEEILHECIRGLLSKKKERPIQDQAQDLECLCQIMKTIGSLLDGQASRNLMNQYFDRIDMFSKKQELPSRIRFMLRDVIDLRNNNWRPRPYQREDTVPQPLSKLREEAGFDVTSNSVIDKLGGNNKNLFDLSKLHGNKINSLLLDDDGPSFTTSADFHWGPTSFMLEDQTYDIFNKSPSTISGSSYNNNNNNINSNSNNSLSKPSPMSTVPTLSAVNSLTTRSSNSNPTLGSLPHANSFSSANTFHKTLKTHPFNQQHLTNPEPSKNVEYRDTSYPNSSLVRSKDNNSRYKMTNSNLNPRAQRPNQQSDQGERRIFGGGGGMKLQPSPPLSDDIRSLERDPLLDTNLQQQSRLTDGIHQRSGNSRNIPFLPNHQRNQRVDLIESGHSRRDTNSHYGQNTQPPRVISPSSNHLPNQAPYTHRTVPGARNAPQDFDDMSARSSGPIDHQVISRFRHHDRRQRHQDEQYSQFMEQKTNQPNIIPATDLDQLQSHNQQRSHQAKPLNGPNFRPQGGNRGERRGPRPAFAQIDPRDQAPIDRPQNQHQQQQQPESEMNMNWRNKLPSAKDISANVKESTTTHRPVSPISSSSSSTSANRHHSSTKILAQTAGPTNNFPSNIRVNEAERVARVPKSNFEPTTDPKAPNQLRQDENLDPRTSNNVEPSFGRRPFITRNYERPVNSRQDNFKTSNNATVTKDIDNTFRNYRGSVSQPNSSQQTNSQQQRGDNSYCDARNQPQAPPSTPQQQLSTNELRTSGLKEAPSYLGPIRGTNEHPRHQPRNLPTGPPQSASHANLKGQNAPLRANNSAGSLSESTSFERREPRRFGSNFHQDGNDSKRSSRHDNDARTGGGRSDRFNDRSSKNSGDSVVPELERGAWRKDANNGPSVKEQQSSNAPSIAPLLTPKPPIKPSDANFSLRPSHNLIGRTPVKPEPIAQENQQKLPQTLGGKSVVATLNQDQQKQSQETGSAHSSNSNPAKSAARDFHVNKFIAVLSEYSSDSPQNFIRAASKIKELKIPKNYQQDCLVSAMKQSILKSENDRVLVGKLFVQLMPNVFDTESLIEAFKVLFDQLKALEIETPRVKSLVAGFVSQAVLDNIMNLEDLGSCLIGGKHHPLFLLVLQKLEKGGGQGWLSEKFVASKINLMDMLPEVDRTKDRLASALKDRCLGFLDPMLTVEPDLWQQMKERDASPAVVYRWIKDNVDQSVQGSPTFAHVLMTCLLKYIHKVANERSKVQNLDQNQQQPQQSEENSPQSDKSTPTNSSGSSMSDFEKEMLIKYQQVLQAILKDKPMQLIALYSLQSFHFGLNFPKGSLLRWFHMLYDLNIVDEDVFFTWKEEINDEFPGKGQALFQVNAWFNWLAETESEEEEDE